MYRSGRSGSTYTAPGTLRQVRSLSQLVGSESQYPDSKNGERVVGHRSWSLRLGRNYIGTEHTLNRRGALGRRHRPGRGHAEQPHMTDAEFQHCRKHFFSAVYRLSRESAPSLRTYTSPSTGPMVRRAPLPHLPWPSRSGLVSEQVMTVVLAHGGGGALTESIRDADGVSLFG
jgi:hypothetical protein